jgi:solute carrier family 25 iron transporter 28/37
MLMKEGLFSFYRSYPITLIMNIPWNGIMIMTNETLKPLIDDDKNHNFVSYFFCAGFSSKNFYLGMIGSLFTMPLDNIKTRL